MSGTIANMTLQEWVSAKMTMTRSDFSQLKKQAAIGGIAVPFGVEPDRSAKIYFEGSDDLLFAKRVGDTKALETFNKEVRLWAKKVEKALKTSALEAFDHREKTDELFPSLAKSIKAKVYSDKKYRLEARSIGFGMARHGVYLQQGAGRGYGGFKGSKWTDRYGTLQRTSKESLGKMDTGSRSATDWFNSIIIKYIPDLQKIFADYSLDITVNFTKLI